MLKKKRVKRLKEPIMSDELNKTIEAHAIKTEDRKIEQAIKVEDIKTDQVVKVEDRKIEEFFKPAIKHDASEFFKEENGNYSSMRLVFILFAAAFIFAWTYVSVVSKPPALADVPIGVQATMLILIAGKGYQKLLETTNDGKNALEKILKKN